MFFEKKQIYKPCIYLLLCITVNHTTFFSKNFTTMKVYREMHAHPLSDCLFFHALPVVILCLSVCNWLAFIRSSTDHPVIITQQRDLTLWTLSSTSVHTERNTHVSTLIYVWVISIPITSDNIKTSDTPLLNLFSFYIATLLDTPTYACVHWLPLLKQKKERCHTHSVCPSQWL